MLSITEIRTGGAISFTGSTLIALRYALAAHRRGQARLAAAARARSTAGRWS